MCLSFVVIEAVTLSKTALGVDRAESDVEGHHGSGSRPALDLAPVDLDSLTGVNKFCCSV